MLNVGNVFDGVRALLNDQAGAVFTNATQLEHFKLAYEEIRQECEQYNIPITNKTSDPIVISVGVTDIGGPTGPALPNDLIEVIECWETPLDDATAYMKMRRCQFLPKTNVITAYLETYSWSEQYLKFLGATGTIQVKIDYIAIGMPDVINEFSLVKLTNAVNFLKFKTAALCSMFIGENETRAAALNMLADDAKNTLLNIKVKSSQGIVTRRRPFMASYKNRGGVYGR